MLDYAMEDEIEVGGLPKSTMVFDGGHNLIKGLRISSGQPKHSFPHALRRLTEAEYAEALARYGKDLPRDYVRVNGAPYVVGESALAYMGLTRVTGPNRYTKDYIGVFMAIMASFLFDKSCEISVFASHPTGDTAYREKLAKAVYGKWTVQYMDHVLEIKVGYVNTFEEIIGGMNNRVLAANGVAYLNADLNKGQVLGVDFGGGTTDWQSISNGKVTDQVSVSIGRGVQDIESRFDKSFRNAPSNLAMFSSVRQLPLNLVRDAITTRVWDGGGTPIPCGSYVDEAVSLLLNEMQTVYENVAKGPGLWRYIILTGGGSAMLFDYIKPILRHNRVLLAHDDIATMHYANIIGGAKLWKLWKAKGWL